MSSNYIIGENVKKETVILKKIETAKKEIEVIANEIIQRKKIYRVVEEHFPKLKSTVINNVMDVVYVKRFVQHQ